MTAIPAILDALAAALAQLLDQPAGQALLGLAGVQLTIGATWLLLYPILNQRAPLPEE